MALLLLDALFSGVAHGRLPPHAGRIPPVVRASDSSARVRRSVAGARTWAASAPGLRSDEVSVYWIRSVSWRIRSTASALESIDGTIKAPVYRVGEDDPKDHLPLVGRQFTRANRIAMPCEATSNC